MGGLERILEMRNEILLNEFLTNESRDSLLHALRLAQKGIVPIVEDLVKSAKEVGEKAGRPVPEDITEKIIKGAYKKGREIALVHGWRSAYRGKLKDAEFYSKDARKYGAKDEETMRIMTYALSSTLCFAQAKAEKLPKIKSNVLMKKELRHISQSLREAKDYTKRRGIDITKRVQKIEKILGKRRYRLGGNSATLSERLYQVKKFGFSGAVS